jgi:F0F1-type ATP synthase membrane subunit a
VLAFVLLCALVFSVYFLGERAGRENPGRSQHVQEIVKLEAELKNRKADLYSKYTPQSFVFVWVVLVVVLILMLFGALGHDDPRYLRH